MGEVILITGTSRGIGKFLAKTYLDRGHMVIGCSRNADNLLNSDLLTKNYRHFELDVTDEIKVKTMFSYVDHEFGGLTVLINNAGIASMNHSILTTIDKVEQVLKTNVTGTFLMCREAVKLMMKKKYGRIINFTTVAVPMKLAGEAIYTASKAAVNSLTQVFAKEYGELGITVNAIGPTPVRTDLVKNVPQEKIDCLLRGLPLKQLGSFEDILNVIDFYIRPESSAITGQIIYLGGA